MASNVTVKDASGVTQTYKTTDNAGVHTGHVNVDSSTLPTGAATAANQTTGNTALSAIQTAVETLDNAIAGSEMQVDVVTMPAVSISGAVDTELTTADLDTGAGTDTRAVVGLVLAASGGGLLVGSANPLPISDNSGSLTIDGTVTANLAAGTNNIGDVDVLSLPALPAGTNNIGDVDVLTLPALPAGTNNIGDVDVLTVPAPLNLTGGGVEASALRVTLANDSTGVLSVDDNGGSLTIDNAALSVTGGGVEASALRVTIANDSTGVLSVDDNGGALTVDNGGTFAVQESGAALTALQLIDNLVVVEDAPAAGGESGVQALAVRKDAAGTLASADGDFTPLQTDSSGNLRVNVAAGGAGDGAILDGVTSSIKATVFDYTNSNPLAVRLTDTAGDYVGAGAGTQYTEDAASAADPVGTQLISRRRDTLSATEVSADGDVIAVNASNKGELYVKHVDSIPVTDNAGSLTVDNAALSVTGGGAEATALRVTIANDSTGVLSVDDNGGSLTVDGTVAVSGTVTVDSELPTAAALADNASNPTAPAVGAFGMVWDGATWDRAAGNSTDGALVNLGANNDVTVTGTVTANLAAGSNNIGDVDILSIAAGDNNIGNVDIVTLPALPAGTNLIGRVNPEPQTANGLSISRVISAATTNATSVKASAGQVYTIIVMNATTGSVRYLKLYNKASAPTVGTDTPVMTIPIPGTSVTGAAGAGVVIDTGGMGIAFSTGIAFALTTGVADADTGAVAANEIVVNLLYK